MDKKTLYEKFVCIGGRCPLTCCKGWEITLDPETYDKWKSKFTKEDHVRHTVSKKKSSGKTEYTINMGQDKCCPYFNEEGLCRIVIRSGEDDLPSICRQFPRIINEYDGRIEKTLSCACPEVVDLLHLEGEMLQLFSREDNGTCGEDFSLREVRDVLVSILEAAEFSLKDRLLLGLILLSEYRKDDITAEETIECYRDSRVYGYPLRLWREGEPDPVDASLEQNELFLDVTENYRREEHYRSYLEPLAAYAEDLDVREMVRRLKTFEGAFSDYDRMLTRILQIKVFSECVGDEIEDLMHAFQRIILEYTMLRHSIFLIALMRGAFEYEDVRNYTVIFSRMIGNNPDGIREFFEGSFEEGIWDPWYFLLLLNQRLD
jgi:lysine-N-methylase